MIRHIAISLNDEREWRCEEKCKDDDNNDEACVCVCVGQTCTCSSWSNSCFSHDSTTRIGHLAGWLDLYEPLCLSDPDVTLDAAQCACAACSVQCALSHSTNDSITDCGSISGSLHSTPVSTQQATQRGRLASSNTQLNSTPLTAE